MTALLTKLQLFLIQHALAQVDPIANQFNDSAGRNYYVKLTPFPVVANKTAGYYVSTVIDLMLWVAGIAAVIYLLYAGILYITSAGDETKAEKGRKGIMNAVIGIVIITLAFVIEKIAAGIFNGA